MFELIRKLMAGRRDNGDGGRDGETKTHIASCVLLLEAAHVDENCSEAEMEHILDILKERFCLSPDCIAELIELSHVERKSAVDLWQFTNQINQQYSLAEKIAVMEDVWRIIHIDGALEKHEDQFAHKIANLLRLTHKQLIDAKLSARGQLER